MLQGKISFITGSTRGIGWATAREFMRQGATVILNHRGSQQILQECCQRLKDEFGGNAIGLVADATDESAINNCYLEIFRRFKRLDVLVNNAGIMKDAPLGMISADLIQTVTNTNLMGSLIHMQQASRLMARNRSGSIVNLASVIGRFGYEGQTLYAASKAAVIGMTFSAAKELAAKNIRVNAVAPGLIDTEMTRQFPADTHERVLKSIRMGRSGQAEEVANVITFLASDMASYVTGQVLGVDGGMIV